MPYQQPYQTLTRRIIAMTIDALLWFGLTSFVQFFDGYQLKQGYILWSLLLEFGFFAYLIIAQATYGTTVGKYLCGLEIAHWQTGGLPDWRGLLKRYAVPILLVSLGNLSLFWYQPTGNSQSFDEIAQTYYAYEVFIFLELSWYCLLVAVALNNKFRRGWHDDWGNTIVIRKRLRVIHERQQRFND